MANLVFRVFKAGRGRFIGGVIMTQDSFFRFAVFQFEVLGLKVSSSAFSTPFCREVRFVTSRALWIYFLEIGLHCVSVPPFVSVFDSLL